MDMLHSIWNLSDPRDVNRKNDRQPSIADQRIRDLQFRIGNLNATCQALCDLMVEKLGVPPEEVKGAIQKALRGRAASASGTSPDAP